MEHRIGQTVHHFAAAESLRINILLHRFVWECILFRKQIVRQCTFLVAEQEKYQKKSA